MYLWAREWNIQPSEFWGMTLAEWWCEFEHRTAQLDKTKYAGRLTKSDVDDLKDWMEKKNGRSKHQG